MRTRRPRFHRSSTLWQLGAAMASFVVCALLLESGGLDSWAERLELGPLRSVAVPIAQRMHATLAPLGLENVRSHAISALARAGWSDDPAALSAESAGPVPVGPLGAATFSPPPGKPGSVPASTIATTPPPQPPPPSTPNVAVLPLAGDPPLLSDLPTLKPVRADRPLTVALAGDSMMAVGLSATILRQSPKYPGVKFVKAFKSGTGLARPEVFNWQQQYPAMLGDERPDVVLVAIGANDGQGFVEAGVTYPFGSDGWRRIYQQRVSAYLQMVGRGGAQVVWLGLPAMKSGVYNGHIALVNRIAYTAVKADSSATWFSTAGIIGDGEGGFRDFGPVAGKLTRLRSGDGIHMSDEGATLVTDKLLPWLAARPMKAEPLPPPAKPAEVKP